MSQADFDKWQRRYLSPDHQAPKDPEPFVVEAVAPLVPGQAVDVAGGLGRHARWLADRGWSTPLIDISPAALARATEETEVRLTTVAADLERTEDAQRALPGARFDLVVCAWFLPSAALWPVMVEALIPGGRLIYVQPTRRNQRRHAHPSPRFLFDDGALADHLRRLGLVVQTYEEGWDPRDHHTARAVAVRPT